MTKDEVDKTRAQAKLLAKFHSYRLLTKRKTPTSSPTSSIGDVTRYSIKGESLRGMENLTDTANGRKRRRVQEEAIRSVGDVQQEQLVQHMSDICFLRTGVDDFSIDTAQLAKVYGSKAHEALEYAKEVAHEDAKVAAKILAEDLQEESSSTSLRSKSKENVSLITTKISNTDTSVAAGSIVKSFPPEKLSHKRIVSPVYIKPAFALVGSEPLLDRI